MNLLEILLETKEYQKASAYLKELNNSYDRKLNIIHYTEDEIVNYMISNKKQAAEEQHIKVRISAAQAEFSALSSQELCCVFDNLFDNAIHANRKVEAEGERFIELFLFEKGGCLSIIMKNRYDGSFAFLESQISKKTGFNETHGYGLQILEGIVTQAHGEISTRIDIEDRIFTMELTIPIQNQEGGAFDEGCNCGR